jgi:hypothetical protein
MENAESTNCVTAVVLSKLLDRLISVVFSLASYTVFCHPDSPFKPSASYPIILNNDVIQNILTPPLA